MDHIEHFNSLAVGLNILHQLKPRNDQLELLQVKMRLRARDFFWMVEKDGGLFPCYLLLFLGVRFSEKEKVSKCM